MSRSIELQRQSTQIPLNGIREAWGKIGTVFVRERPWIECSKNSFLVHAPKYIPDFETHSEKDRDFLGALDILTRIYRMPVAQIMRDSKKDTTYIDVIGRIVNYLTYEYLPKGYMVSKKDSKEEVDTRARNSLLAVAKDSRLESFVDKDTADDLKRRAGIEIPLEIYIGFGK